MPLSPPAIARETRALAALLTHPDPAGAAALDEARLAQADRHGITGLLAGTLRAAGLTDALAGPVRAALDAAVRGAVAMDAVQTAHASRAVAALRAAGVVPILFKGAALATTHYAHPWERPRGDVDLLVSTDRLAAAAAALEGIGCRRVERPAGSFVTYQARFVAAVGAVETAYDLHWRVADPQAFGHLFTYDGLAADAVAGPVPGSRQAGPVSALLIACVHRAAHHFDTDRLLLLCDVDRLARGLAPADWDRFAALAEAGAVRAVCARALDLSAALLETPVPAAVRDRLAQGGREPSARFVGGELRRVDVLRSDLARLETWRARAALVQEHLFPPRAFMAARYGVDRPLLLPFLYADRILRGVTRWFRPVR